MANELNGAAWPAVVAASDAVDDPVVTCGAADGAVPLALAQRRLWFLSTLGRAAARAYVMPAGMRLRGALDVPALRRALDLLAQRHDALRTRFGLADGEPVQSIAAAAGARFALVEHDLRRDADAEAALDALVEHESAAPFDLEHGPLIRGRVVALPGDEHVWLLSAHHAIFDGRSMERFAHELADLYRGLRDGAAVVLPPAGRYADCVAIQRTDAFAATLREQSAYWREALRDAPPTSTLPADRARGARHDFAGGLVDGRLDATRTARLRALARRHESSLFGVLLAAWVVLLQRLNRQDEAVVGVTTDGRTQREYDGVVGCFVGTVPVRVTRASTPAAAIRATAQRLRAARAHQDLPFDQIVEAAHAERSLAQNPLFQTALTWYGSRIESFRFDGTEPSALPAVARRYGVAPDGASRDALILYGGIGDRVHAKHDVTLLLWEAGGSIHIGAEYATALYDRDTIARCLGYWTRLLDAFADDDAQPLARIALVDPVERRQLVDGWNATAVARPATTLPALFAQTAQAMPGAPALNCGGAILSYAELQRRVRRVAQRLAAHGIGRGSRVGVAMARRSELVVALLAVLDAGAAYVPLDPLHPPERRAHILRDAGVAALLVCGDESGTDGRDAVPRIDVAAADGTDAPDIAQSPAAPGDLAYVIYTSGTTGKPKGVAIGHAALLNLLLAMRDELAIAAGDRVLALTTIAFDIAALELFLPLIAGGCVVLADRAAAQDPRALAALLERERVDVMQATPTGWRVLLDGGWTGRAGLKALCGGEALPSELARRLAARVGTLWNVYGPTETTIWSTIQRIDAGCAAATTACIGRPLANTQAYVLDGGGELAPTGIVGELYLGGAGLARGYVGLDALTRERFVANPFAAGERLYRTGDLAWRDRDGRLHHAGRTDAQIKLNGYRIELEEIEAQLAMHAAVREAAVALRRDAAGYARLVGYCVLADERGDAAADRTDELRAHLLTSLPSYMVPEAFVVLEHLPVSPNGKTDRAALPEPLAIARGGHEAPRPGVESEVAAVWSELLDGRVIDRRDHFFRLGGHSLLAVRVLVRLRRALGVEVNVAELFAHPTLDAFAAAVARAGRSALPPIVPAARSGDLPLSSAQQRLWFLAQTGADASRAYHMPVVLHLDGALDRDALRRAIAAILARHEALRTVFPARAGRPVQQIRDTADIALPWRDASIDDDASAVDTAIAAEVARAFDLTCALPLRVALLRCGPRAHIAVITIHHIACDGWSLALFLRELQAHYAAACCGDTAALPALAVQYADYAQWLQNVQGATGFALATAYWTQRLADAPALFELPSDRPRPAQQDYSGDLVACTIGADLTRGLHRLAEQCGATLFMTALAAWVALLARLSDARDFVLGMPSANRDSAETEALIGFFANTLALRFELGADPTVAELVALTRDEVLAAQQHRELPFEQLVEALNPPRSAACTPLFQIAFAWQSVPPVDLALPGVSTTQRPLYRAGTAKFDLTLYLWQSGDTLRGGVEYATSLFDRATIERYLAHWNVLLRAFVADPQRRLMALPLLTPAQREALIGVACGPRVAFGEGRVHRLVEVTARRERDAPAVVQGARSLSYAELDRRATALAQRLRAHDLGAGARIGVLMRRSPELIVALLGVLKCGAAYVLLDTAAPAQRTACLLVDAQARAVVGDGPEPLELGDGALALPRFVVAPDDDAIPGRDPAPAPAVERDDDIAYVVFTSGSTGTPKGVLVGHRGFANFVQAMRDALGLQRGDRVSGACGLGFDASLIDIWPTLCAGATLVLTPVEPAQDADAFLRWWRAERLHCSMLPTPLAEIVLAHGIVPPTLRTLATGGAALTRRPPAGATYRLLNAYGPAEASVVTTIGDVAHDDRITIGQPLPNVCAYVLDDAGEPQPIGIPGELYVGGAGVAAGYIGLTELDESRFPPDPFSSAPGARLYRSGDRVRRLADGRIEYLGRRDEQIKLRGMRIEPGEIETCLAALPAVREAAVVHVANAAGEGRLVAYVSVRAEATADLEDERIADWQRLYDDNYRGPNRDALFNFDGWNSSLTGEPIPLDEMEQWQDETVARIRALRPRRVLEIGCGSGLLLLRLAPDCARYVGVDLSQEALVSLQRKIEQAGIRGVELVHARADALDTLAPESFDTVILNSVAQYFPDRDYLERVVAAALARLQPGGALFVGDVRNLLLLDAFHQAIQQARATPAADLAEAARRAAAQEKELLIAPAWFARAGAGTHAVQVLPKTAPNANEMTAFRYDVVLRDAMPAIARQRVFEAHDTGAFAAAMAWARANPDAVAILTPLRNALVDSDSDGDNGDTEDSCIAPADAVRRAIHGDLIAQPSWIASDTRGRFHLLITASDPALLHDHVALLRGVAAEADGAMTNAPTQQANEARLRRELVAALARKLPEYMIPAQFVFLARLPLSRNGKVDRARLPQVDLPRSERFRPLRSDTERRVAAIWNDVLGARVLGASDHFFELGGHSLAAVQVLARVRDALNVEVSLADLFAHPILADFAERLARAAPAAAPRIGRVPRDAPLPLSFEQEGLWFLGKLPGAAAAYNMIAARRLDGPLDVSALRRAVDALGHRHEALRTRFGEIDGRPVMRTDRTTPPPLRIVDIAEDPERRLQQLLDEESDRQFDLEAAPPVRFSLLRETPRRHVLLLSMHHIVGDGWSIDVLLRDIGRLYDAEIHAGRARPEPLAIQYADFASAQRRIEVRRFERLAAYWRTALAGAPPLLELPTDRLRPTQQDFRGAFLPCRLDASLSARVRAASRRFDTTPFVLLLTSWALLLSRLSGQDDLVVGVPSANRSAPETQDLVGLLVSTLPLRVPLNGAPRLSLLLKRVERRMLDAQQHQDIAFEKIVELVCSTRSLAYNPLFQVLFAWQGGRPESLRIDGLTTTLLRADCSPRHAKFDLSLLLFDDDGVIHGGIEYASALFDAPTIERCRDHWFAVLAQLVQGEDIDPQRVELLAPAQRNELLDRWNATARDFPRERCLHELVEAQAAETPDAIALEFEAESLTYAELDRRAARLAARLRSRGATVGSFVAIHIARSPAMIVAVLAVLKAGAAYVPLDTLHPSARKAHILDDCRPGWLLHAGDAPVFERLAAPPQAIDVSADDDGDAAPAVATASTQLAYLIYTSGSTGLPKGVMVEHRSVVNRLVWMLHHFPIEADDAVLQKTALGFDVSVWEIFVPLICGARLVLADSGAQADPERLARILRERRITVVHFVPSMLHLFLAQLRGAVFPDLHHVICSGEELPRVVVEDFQHRLPRTALYNLYGPTEASIEVSWHRCELDHGAPRVPIGRPIDNCRLYVLDRHHRLLPPGVTGELFIGGTPVARGYFRRPALTSERFLPDPLTRDANARMYKTGDQARWLPNGEVDFLGRNDAQIKLRGFRIEPSEIETQLARFPGVEEAAVALHQDATRGASLVGYWVGDAAIDAAVLRDYLGAAVPDYMVPTFFVRLDRLPLNANGKLDRAALPAPDTVRAGAASAQAFEGELEHRIAAVWHEVLGRSGFGRDDNFFAVGGHSLLTLRLRTRLAAAALPVEIADLFRYPTIATLARAIARRGGATAAASCVRADGDTAPLFLLHDGFGLTLYAHALAAHLPAGFPIHVLDDTAAVQDESASVPLLADRLLGALRRVQPHGPYRLAGWSFGGLLAYELATRLVDAGEPVDYLGLIDSYYRFDEPTTDEPPADFIDVPVYIAALEPARRRECLARHEIYAIAARRYAARSLHLTVDLIKAQRCDFPSMQNCRGWERVLPAEAIRLHEVPGCHYSMMSVPFVAAAAAAVARGLALRGPS